MSRAQKPDQHERFYESLSRRCTDDVMLVIKSRCDLEAVVGEKVPDDFYAGIQNLSEKAGLSLGKTIYKHCSDERNRLEKEPVVKLMRRFTHAPDGTPFSSEEANDAVRRYLKEREDRQQRKRYDAAHADLAKAQDRHDKGRS